MEDINYEELDPGIRKLVQLLRDNGFVTTDSGDGVTKFEDGDAPCSCAEPMPNVYIETSRELMLTEVDRLVELLKRSVRAGLLEETFVDPTIDQEVPLVIIEATYLPMSGASILAVHGICDKDLVILEVV